MFIIDFDGTLFDSYAFAEARIEALGIFGVSKDLFQKTYQLTRNGKAGFVSYSDAGHAEVLAEYGFDRDKVYQALKNITENCQKYLYPDTLFFLEDFKKRGEELILLSLGIVSFQEEKIKNSGIHNYFQRVFMVEDTKKHILKELFGSVTEKKVWFINDKVGETKELAEVFPQLIPVMMVSKFFPESDYKNSGLPYFKTLNEIKEYILKNYAK